MSRHFSLDSVAVRDRRLFGWGWFLDTGLRMRSAEFRIPLVDGSDAIVPCLEGAARPDVAAAFPSAPHAAAAGFMMMARLRARPDLARASRFVAELDDGATHEIELPTLLQPAGPAQPGWRRLGARLREAGAAGLASSVRQRLRTGLDGLRGRRARAWLALSGAPVVVVLDHAMGGGANVYREKLVQDCGEGGAVVVLVTPRLASLDYLVQFRRRGRATVSLPVDDVSGLVALLGRLRVRAVHVNNLVSFDDPLALVDWCVAARAGGAQLTFHLHDFHAVCPSFTLIDDSGRYCDLPSLDRCRSCLPRNSANSLGLGLDVDIAQWRGAWSRLLDEADAIVAFSEASASILRRAHPGLAPDAIRIVPHRPSNASLRAVARGGGEIVKVAVIGNISRPKGAHIVEGVADLARSRGLPLQVVVIGTLQTSGVGDAHLAIHGRFDNDELPDLLERYGIDVCLMPSICPETYSYVTDEIMAMQVPLVVFDIGAPAERVARYRLGHVIAETTAEAALAGIMRAAGRAQVQTRSESDSRSALDG